MSSQFQPISCNEATEYETKNLNCDLYSCRLPLLAAEDFGNETDLQLGAKEVILKSAGLSKGFLPANNKSYWQGGIFRLNKLPAGRAAK